MPGESPVIAKGAKLTPDQVKKLDQGYEFVEVPSRDAYDYEFTGFWINGEHFKPGKHLLAPDWATEAKRILAAWSRANIRLLRPTPHRQSLSETPLGQDSGLTAPPAEA